MVTDGNTAYNWFAELRNIQHEQISASQHSRGPFSLAHINAIHSKLTTYWPDNGQRLPAMKYLDLNLLLFWWIEKNGHLTAPEKTEELFSYIENRLLCTTSYQSLQLQPISLMIHLPFLPSLVNSKRIGNDSKNKKYFLFLLFMLIGIILIIKKK